MTGGKLSRLTSRFRMYQPVIDFQLESICALFLWNENSDALYRMQQRILCLIRLSRSKSYHSGYSFCRIVGTNHPHRAIMNRIIPNRSQSDANLVDEEHSHAGCSNNEGSATTMDVELGLESHIPVLLFQSEHYLVIDKPCGVRMNGEFEGSSTILPVSIMIAAYCWRIC